ncbi:prepilin peptidase [Patescibacteria group bacterium]|nr:prepilin peptidase [Patescibacteria group bacterium]
MTAFFVFILGAMIGSFLNVLILRLKDNKKFVAGRSYCPKCKHELKWYENVPLLSFIFLKGKCSYCKQKISLQYFLVELTTGLLFLLAFLNIFGGLNTPPPLFKGGLGGVNIYLLYYFITLSFLIIIFVYDLKYYLILDKIVIPAIIIVAIFQAIFLILNKDPLFIIHYSLFIASAVVISGFFLIQFLVSKGKWIGGGDIRLGFLMGIILGWPMGLVALFLSYIFGLAVSLPLLILGKKKMKSEVAFGTFLVTGTIITMFYGQQILNWYLNLF